MRKELIKLDIPIPSSDGKSVAYTIPVEVPARYEEDLDDYVLDGYAMEEIDRIKARHMGLLQPDQIKALRDRLSLTQKDISELLQIGEKTWSRWENGRERPSRSMNILIRSLDDGKIDPNYLRSLKSAKGDVWRNIIQLSEVPANIPISLDPIPDDNYSPVANEEMERVA